MTTLLFANNAETVLATAALSTDTVLNLAVGTGIVFPAPSANQTIILTLASALNSAIAEIVYCTNITVDSITVIRAQEGTIARTWNIGDFVANLLTAGTLNYFNQASGGTTAQRPTSPYIYQSYYDQTLSLPIWCAQITPSIIWHNAAGEPV